MSGIIRVDQLLRLHEKQRPEQSYRVSDLLSLAEDQPLTEQEFDAPGGGITGGIARSAQRTVAELPPPPAPAPRAPPVAPIDRGDEAAFRIWYEEQAQNLGLVPDPDDPKHAYDWRAAWRSGAAADDAGHWPSEFKQAGHPNLIVDGRDTRTGRRVIGPGGGITGGVAASAAAHAGTSRPPPPVPIAPTDRPGAVVESPSLPPLSPVAARSYWDGPPEPPIEEMTEAQRGVRVGLEAIPETAGHFVRQLGQRFRDGTGGLPEVARRLPQFAPPAFAEGLGAALETKGREIAGAAHERKVALGGPKTSLADAWENAKDGDFEALVDWAMFSVPQGLASTAPVLGGALVGGPGGAAVAAAALSQNEARNELMAAGVDEATADQIAGPTGVAMGALEMLMPARLGKELTGPIRRQALRQIAGRVARGSLSSGALEGVTETGQSLISQGVTSVTTGQPISVAQLLEEGVAGGLTGLLMGGGGQAVSAARPADTGAIPMGPEIESDDPELARIMSETDEQRAGRLQEEVGKPEGILTRVRRGISERLFPEGVEERRDAERASLTDAQTGLANRAAFDRARDAAEADPNTAVVVFDAQNLKAVNDKVSYEAGNQYIQQAAQAIRQAAEEVLGTSERVFRVGGDEFAIFAPEAQRQEVAQRALELMPKGEVEGFQTGLRVAIGGTFNAADASIQEAKGREAGRYRPMAPAPGAEATPAEAAVPAPTTTPEPGVPTPDDPSAPAQIAQVHSSQILRDPERFQFKQLGAEGVGSELKGVDQWNPRLAGVISVWRDPETGETFVVNGHHRHELAERTGGQALNVQYVDAPTSEKARAAGAFMNIAEGRGSPTDVAKFLRDMDASLDDLRAEGVSLRGDLARKGVALSRLAPDVFDQVATAKIPERWGVAIGEVLDDPVLQREALNAVRGSRLSEAEVREVARQVLAAGTETTTQETLFGTEEESQGLFVPRAQLAAAVRRRLSKDRKLFGYVSRGTRAEELARAGGTTIDVEAARQLAEQGAQAEEVFGRLYTRSGPVAEVVNEGARRIARGEPVKAVVDDIYSGIGEAVQSELASQVGRPGPGPGQEGTAPTGEGERSGDQAVEPEGPIDKDLEASGQTALLDVEEQASLSAGPFADPERPRRAPRMEELAPEDRPVEVDVSPEAREAAAQLEGELDPPPRGRRMSAADAVMLANDRTAARLNRENIEKRLDRFAKAGMLDSGPSTSESVREQIAYVETLLRTRDWERLPSALDELEKIRGEDAPVSSAQLPLSDPAEVQGGLFGESELVSGEEQRELFGTEPTTPPPQGTEARERWERKMRPDEIEPREGGEPEGERPLTLLDPETSPLPEVRTTPPADPISAPSLSDIVFVEEDSDVAFEARQIGDRLAGSLTVPKGTEKKTPVNAPQIMQQLSKVTEAAGKRLRMRSGQRGIPKGARGAYYPVQDVMRTLFANSIPTGTHELGHAVEDLIYGFPKAGPWKKPLVSPVIQKELTALGKALYGKRKPAGGYKREGWAEFMRMWVTRTDLQGNEVNVADHAPQLSKWFDEVFSDQFPEVRKELEQARELTDRYRAQGSRKRIEGHVVDPGSPANRAKRAIEGTQDFFSATNWIDQALPLAELSKAAERELGRPLAIEDDPYQTISALQKTHDARVRYMVEEAMIDLAGNPVGKPLEDVRPLIEGRRTDFTIYLLAQRTLALAQDSKQRKTGISVEDALQVIEELDSPEFQIAASMVYEWNEGVLRYAAQASPTFRQIVDRILARDPGAYVPLQREFEQIEGAYGKTTGGSVLQRLRGSTQRIKDPLQVMIGRASTMVAQAHKRAVLDQILRLSRIPGIGEQIFEVEKDRRPAYHASVEKLIEEIEQRVGTVDLPDLQGVGQADIADLLGQTVTFYAPIQSPTTQDAENPIVPIFDQGTVRWFEVPKQLYESLAAIDIYRMPKAADLILGVPTRMFRAGTTGLRASFGLVTNPLRDPQTFYVNTQANAHAPRLFFEWLRSFGEVWLWRTTGKRTEWVDAWVRLGLEMAQPLGQDIQHTRRAARRLAQGRVARTLDPRNVYDLLRDLIQTPEAAPRVAELRMIAKEIGWKPGQPMSFAQSLRMINAPSQVTTDFRSAGRLGRVMNQIAPFFNAAIQGPRAHYRALKRNPVKFMRRGMYMTAMSLALWWKMKDEDWYEEMDARERYLYWHIPFDHPVTGEEELLRIPRAFEVGGIFAAMPEFLADAAYRNDPELMTEWFETFVASSAPPAFSIVNVGGLPIPVPQNPLMLQTMEQLGNRDYYFDRPVVPRGEQDMPDEEQFNEYTSGLAVKLGGWFNASPRRIDHAIQGIFGPVGGDVTDVIDLLGLGAERHPREKELADLPIVGRLFRRGGVLGTRPKSVDEMYDALAEAIQHQRSRKGETEQQRQLRLQLTDAQRAVSAALYIRQYTESSTQRRRLTKEAAEIAKEATNAYQHEQLNREKFAEQRRTREEQAEKVGPRSEREPERRPVTPRSRSRSRQRR